MRPILHENKGWRKKKIDPCSFIMIDFLWTFWLFSAHFESFELFMGLSNHFLVFLKILWAVSNFLGFYQDFWRRDMIKTAKFQKRYAFCMKNTPHIFKLLQGSVNGTVVQCIFFSFQWNLTIKCWNVAQKTLPIWIFYCFKAGPLKFAEIFQWIIKGNFTWKKIKISLAMNTVFCLRFQQQMLLRYLKSFY